MRFSVVIPAYNCKCTLENTVDSVLRSGLFDYEIVLIDDGSSDGTSEICDTLAAASGNIRCIHQANCGASIARNRGLEASRGEYVLFFDSDDTVDPGALRHAAQIIRRLRPDMLIFGLSFDYYYQGRMYRRDELVCPKEGMLSREQWGAEFSELYQCNALSPVWNKFIRREILMANQIRFCEDLIEMEDFLLVVQCLAHCGDIYVLPEVVYRYRQAENERSTFNRLLRIPSLTAYMQPFETAVGQIVDLLSQQSSDLADINGIVGQIYSTFFHEVMYYGSIAQIETAASDLMGGAYAQVLKESDPKLFRLLEERKYRVVQRRSVKLRLRHWLAVRVKYLASFRRQ